MLELSNVARQLPYSATRVLVPYAQAAQARGLKVYKLNIGQPDVAAPESAIEAVRNIDMKLISYPDSHGNAGLLKGMSEYYKGIGINVEPEEIVTTVGGSEAVSIVMGATCNPGDEMIVFEPFYANYLNMAIQHGIKLVPITTHIEDGFALPDMAEVEKKITPRTKAVLVINPGNPSGCLYSKEALLELGAIAKKHDLWVVADEVYREFCYTDEPHFSCMHIPGLEQNVILIDSASKRWSLCGTRIGFVVSHHKDMMNAVLRYAQARLCAPALGQIAVEGALKAPQSYYDATRTEYISRRDAMLAELRKIDGVVAPTPLGAFYAVAQLPVDDSTKFCIWMLEHFSHEGWTVQMTPMGGFYFDAEKGRQQVRLAYVLEKEKLVKAMDILRRGLEVYPGRIK